MIEKKPHVFLAKEGASRYKVYPIVYLPAGTQVSSWGSPIQSNGNWVIDIVLDSNGSSPGHNEPQNPHIINDSGDFKIITNVREGGRVKGSVTNNSSDAYPTFGP